MFCSWDNLFFLIQCSAARPLLARTPNLADPLSKTPAKYVAGELCILFLLLSSLAFNRREYGVIMLQKIVHVFAFFIVCFKGNHNLSSVTKHICT